MSSDSELHALVEAGLFRDAAKKIDQQQDPITSVRVLRAQLEAHVGTPHNARALAQKLLREKLTHKDKCLCWELIGRVCLSVGQLDDGLRAMTRAFNESAETQDLQVEARLQSSYVHALLAWVGTEPAVLEIPKLRHIAVRAGDPYSMIAFHYLVASIDARKGLTKSALASIEIARDLLNRFDNLWQRGRLAIVCYAVSMFQADYESALDWNREAIECARRSGSRELTIPALANLAFVKFSQNELDDARSALSELIHELKKGGLSIAEIAVRDIEMQLAIAAEDLDGAAAVDDYITSLISEVGGKDSYYDLWHSLIRVKWFYRRGRPHDGVAIAVDALPRIARTADRILLQKMKLLAAEGYGRISQPERGAALMAAAVVENPDNSLELAAEVFRIAGRLTAHDNPGGALKHFDRAWRTFDGIGNFIGRAEVERDCQEILGQSPLVDSKQHGADKLEATPSISVPADMRTPVAPLTERIAALVETGTHVPLLATGILSLLADTNSVQFGAIVATHTNGRRQSLHSFSSTGPSAAPADHPDAVRIEFGHHQDLKYEIVTLPLPTASARATVLSIERLTYTAVAFAQARQREREQSALWREPTPEKQLGLLCASDRTLDLIKTVRRVAGSNVTVLLTGETGVGKELFARALHQASSRSEKTFLPFNCSTVPRDMFDSQLFGHRRGSFTGAHEDSAGVIRAAAGGTLFLDEIGEMSLDVQPKLLRFLESGEVQPLGDPKPKLVDVRVVAATNANLDQLVNDGRFREDLFYRLNVIRINIPPLRERREEIPAMVEHFLEKFGRELQKPMLRIADETLEYLVLYRWPGNVRQLANELRRMVAMAEPGSVLMPAHLSDEIASSRRTVPASAPQLRQSTEVVTRIDQPLSAAVEHIERAAIQRAIKLADGRLDDAAKMLGLSRKGLYLKRQRLNLE